jgi:hypothetical protein
VNLFVLSVAVACACSCPRSPGAGSPPPIPQDATTVDGAAYTPCDMACARYRELGCPEGADTAADEGGRRHRCEEVCGNAAAHGIDLAGAVACTSGAGSCQVVRSCSK